MEIDALITSVDDPQLPRCLDAVKNQTVPFARIVHMNNVCPSSVAFNQGMSQTSADWVMHLGGDMILDLDAVDRVMDYMDENEGENIAGYFFGLFDTFLECKIGYVGVLRRDLYTAMPLEDDFLCDLRLVHKFRKKGFEIIKTMNLVIGTHCDQPDELQVFTRCYIHGIRYASESHKSLKWKLVGLMKKRDDPLYQLGIDAIHYAEKKKEYPGSHNLTFDKKNYDEFRLERRTSK